MPDKMIVSHIAAMAENRVIGTDGDLPWSIPAEMKYFMVTTKGHSLIVGRKTYESFPKRPLPNRFNIVITRNRDYEAPGSVVCGSLEEALQAAEKASAEWTNEVFVCGGGEIYRQSLPMTQRFYITTVHREVEGDTLYPDVDFGLMKKVRSERFEEPIPYSVELFER